MRGNLASSRAAPASFSGVAWFAGRFPHSRASAMPWARPQALAKAALAARASATATTARWKCLVGALDLVALYW